ncbi:MAG: acyl carrier protein [Actinoallomurus sp.]
MSRETAPTRETDGLIEVLSDVLEIPGDELLDDVGPGTHAGWTSLKHVELVVAIEENYGVTLSHKEIRGLVDVRAVRTLLRAKGVSGASS